MNDALWNPVMAKNCTDGVGLQQVAPLLNRTWPPWAFHLCISQHWPGSGAKTPSRMEQASGICKVKDSKAYVNVTSRSQPLSPGGQANCWSLVTGR